MKKLIDKIFSPKYLFLTNVITGMILHGTGDIIGQNIEMFDNPDKKFNFTRFYAMTTGGIFYGTSGHLFYSYIDRRFPGRSASNICKKLLADAAVCPPIITIGTTVVGKVEGKSYNHIYNDLKDNILFLIAVDTVVYLPIQVFNFCLIEPRFRYVFLAVSSLFYTTCISYILHRSDYKYVSFDERKTG